MAAATLARGWERSSRRRSSTRWASAWQALSCLSSRAPPTGTPPTYPPYPLSSSPLLTPLLTPLYRLQFSTAMITVSTVAVTEEVVAALGGLLYFQASLPQVSQKPHPSVQKCHPVPYTCCPSFLHSTQKGLQEVRDLGGARLHGGKSPGAWLRRCDGLPAAPRDGRRRRRGSGHEPAPGAHDEWHPRRGVNAHDASA